MPDNGAKELNQLYANNIKAGDRCLDIGANTGRMSWIMLKHLRGTGEVISWEPDPIIFKKGIGHYKLKNLKPRCKAVSLKDGTEQFHIHDEPGRSRLDFVKGGKEYIEVQTEQLDTWWLNNNKLKVDIVKIDCATDNARVIKSGMKMLKNSRPKICTVEAEPDKLLIDEILASVGYEEDQNFKSQWDICYRPKILPTE
jgi:FkbM family methyltransferase